MGISKNLTEEDVKFRYINEAITSKGWSRIVYLWNRKLNLQTVKLVFMVILCIERNRSFPTISRSARLLIMKLIRHWRRYSVSWG